MVMTRQDPCLVPLNMLTLGARPGEWVPSYFLWTVCIIETWNGIFPLPGYHGAPGGAPSDTLTSLAHTPRAGWGKFCCGVLSGVCGPWSLRHYGTVVGYHPDLPGVLCASNHFSCKKPLNQCICLSPYFSGSARREERIWA